MEQKKYRKWDRFDLTYSIMNYNPKLEKDSQDAAIKWAFQLWSDSTEFKFKQVEVHSNADIQLRWIHDEDQDMGWANPPPWNNEPQPEDGNIWFNLKSTWTFGIRNSAEAPYDFLTLCAHEIGHAIGIGHLRQVSTLMMQNYSGSIRELGYYEISCFTKLYMEIYQCEFFEEEVKALKCH